MRRQYLSKKTILKALNLNIPVAETTTQAELQRWLREEEGINVHVLLYNDKVTPTRWNCFIGEDYICGSFCYEKALEKGLRKALKLLV